MKTILARFGAWLMRLTIFARYLVVAILLHVLILLVLGSAKIIAKIDADPIIPNGFMHSAASEKEADPELLQLPRNADRQAVAIGGSSGAPDPGSGGLKTAAGKALTDYQPAIAGTEKSAVDNRMSEIFGIISDTANAVPRLETGAGNVTGPTGGAGDSKIDLVGGRGLGANFGQRFGSQRAKCAHDNGSNSESERAVLGALRWLKDHQEADGSWNKAKNTDALSALAVLALLGHGETPDSEEFGQTVSKGIAYIAGCIGENGIVKSQNMYAQGAVTLALAEAYGMTQSANARAPLEQAVAANLRTQKMKKTKTIHTGGWRYAPQSADADTSVTGWLVMGLKSARLAGIAIPDEAFEMAANYLWNMYSDQGGFGYSESGRGINTSAVGILCQQFMGHGDDQRLKKALDVYKKQKVDWSHANQSDALYGWYYLTQAMFQAGGTYWTYWNKEIRDTIVKVQATDGHWDPPPNSGREKDYGQVYSTTLCCLMLEVYYRYLPLYQDREQKAVPRSTVTTVRAGNA